MQRIVTSQLEYGSTATNYEPYETTSLYLQGDKLGYSSNEVRDTIEYKNGKFYFIQKIDPSTMNPILPYVETEIPTYGALLGRKGSTITIENLKLDADIYTNKIVISTEIKELKELSKITNGVEEKLDSSQAVIASNKLSFTHPDLVNEDYVLYGYSEEGDFLEPVVDIGYFIDGMVKSSPDGKIWKLD